MKAFLADSVGTFDHFFAALVSDNTLTRAERSAVVVFLKSEFDGVEEKYGEQTG